MTIQRFMLGLALLWMTGCGRPPEASYDGQLFAFGTLVDISLYGVEPKRAREAVQAG